jgi:hypothetical protein
MPPALKLTTSPPIGGMDALPEPPPSLGSHTWVLRLGYRRAGRFDVDDALAGTGVVG